jgi:glyoxylase-like metal-dependent hydrolase (beta-lactamase superfamily II)
MSRPCGRAAAIALLALAATAGCGSTELVCDQRIVPVAPGVVAYLGGFSNSVTVDTGMGLLLIDTKMDAPLIRRSRKLHDDLAKRGEHVRWIAITHPHRDHLAGLANFAGDSDLEEIWGAPLDGAFRLPGATKFVAIDKPTIRQIGEVEVHLIPFAHAHTGGDLVIWLPKTQTVVAGDIVMCGHYPRGYYPHAEYEDGGSYKGLLRAAKDIQHLHPAWVVGGHGDVCSGAELDDYVNHIEQVMNQTPPSEGPAYRNISKPLLRVISSQDKLKRCAALENKQGDWNHAPTIDPDTPYLESKLERCP